MREPNGGINLCGKVGESQRNLRNLSHHDVTLTVKKEKEQKEVLGTQHNPRQFQQSSL